MNTIVTATSKVHEVNPVRSTLENHIDHLERDIAYSGHIAGLLADAEALNDEIDHLRQVAQRAQQREAQAVKRCEVLEAGLIFANDRFQEKEMVGSAARCRMYLQGHP